MYLLLLLWLVLFKFSSDPLSVVANYHTRSLNLIPFGGISRSHLSETAYNIIAFIPFGLLLGVNLRKSGFWCKLAYIGAFSIALETMQFIFAIGRTDINDVITNTLGGLAGLLVYRLVEKYIDNKKLDRCICVVGVALVVVFLALRILVFRVRYQAHY